MDDATFLTGQLLIAMPGIGDPRFERALIYVCAHDQEHAMGLAVNRPVEGLTLPDLLRRLDIDTVIAAPENLVLMGGPVQRERGFVLHTDDYASADGTVPIVEGVALTATRDALEALAGRKAQPPRRAVLALGYAGWGAGQLENEMAQNAWLSVRADARIIFGVPPEQRYPAALQLLGIDPVMLAGEAGHA